jgi:hypothetical protein
MLQEELEKDFRATAQDKVGPEFLFDRADVARWLIEAEQEACIRGRLLHDSSTPAVCEIPVVAGVSSYPLHAALYEIDHLGLKLSGATDRRRVQLVSKEWLDEHLNGWRDRSGTPEYAIQGDTSLRLVPRPDAAATLLLEGYRLPIRGLTADAKSKPEIFQAHHRHLVNWALYRAFSQPDSETMDLGRAGDAEAAFTAYFGPRPDSDLRRLTQEDGQHHNQAWI